MQKAIKQTIGKTTYAYFIDAFLYNDSSTNFYILIHATLQGYSFKALKSVVRQEKCDKLR